MDKIQLADNFGCAVIPPKALSGDIEKLKGRWLIQILDENNKLVHEEDFSNLVVNQGKTYILNTSFNSGGAVGPSGWYLGLIGTTGYSALSPNDTAASHAGWTEENSYSQATRPAWGPGAPANQQVTNATPVEFSINASVTVKGFFVISNNTKGGTAGTLLSEGLFSAGDQVLANGFTLRCVYVLGF